MQDLSQGVQENIFKNKLKYKTNPKKNFTYIIFFFFFLGKSRGFIWTPWLSYSAAPAPPTLVHSFALAYTLDQLMLRLLSFSFCNTLTLLHITTHTYIMVLLSWQIGFPYMNCIWLNGLYMWLLKSHNIFKILSSKLFVIILDYF